MQSCFRVLICIVLLLSVVLAQATSSKKTASIPVNTQSMNQLIEGNLYKELDYFAQKLDEGGESTRIDGVKVFKSDDKFIPGKIAIALGELVLHAKNGSQEQRRYLRIFKKIGRAHV